MFVVDNWSAAQQMKSAGPVSSPFPLLYERVKRSEIFQGAVVALQLLGVTCMHSWQLNVRSQAKSQLTPQRPT